MQTIKQSVLRIIVFINMFLFGVSASGEVISKYPVTFVDDLGREITVTAPAKRIISLYSAHTENLYSLGLDEEVIGVGRVGIYPPKVLTKPHYDFRSDPEKVIAADPDLVLIRTYIYRSRPEFVEALEKGGLRVVALYPESFGDFERYVRTLAVLSGTQERAKALLHKFFQDISAIRRRTQAITPKVGVYFESVEKGYKTITPDSTAALAIEAAGGINLAQDAVPMKKGSSIGLYGIEKLLDHADEIDVYITQRGAMHAGGSVHSISTRPGFYAVKAVREKRVYVINEKIMSSPTFRHLKGICELARMFYPEIMNDLSGFKTDEDMTREKMAELVVRFKHKPIFVPTSRYYRKKHKGHTYGTFQDVDVEHPVFDFIETAVISGYMDYETVNGGEWFSPHHKVTRGEFAKILFMLADLEPPRRQLEIKDLDAAANANIVRLIVNHGILECQNGYFFPENVVTGKDVLTALGRLSALSIAD